MQITRCFRDEDLRADRQPEFTQVDLEMSFIDEEDVAELIEGLFAAVFPLAGIEVERPFPRLTYADAMARYGSDRPDLRFGLEIVDLGAALGESGFRGFQAAVAEGGVIRGFAVPGAAAASRKQVDGWAELARRHGAAGALTLRRRDGEIQFTVKTALTAAELERAAAALELGEGDLALIAGIECFTEQVAPSEWAGEEELSVSRDVVEVELAARRLPALRSLERHFFTSSACGVCGRAALDEMLVAGCEPVAPGPVFARETIRSLPDALRAGQRAFEATGGLHAAALFDAEGRCLAVWEDVGRHNAFDKLVGRALLDGALGPERTLGQHAVLVSGRASFELLQKCVAAGVPMLCAVSAPSSLAVEMARRFHITLVAFLRGDRFNVYSAPERVGL